jgi:hypothetical protein
MGAISCAYLVPATQTPWGPLTPNNPLTSHLDGEERVGAAMATAGVATATAGVARATADATMLARQPTRQWRGVGPAMATAEAGAATVTADATMASWPCHRRSGGSCFKVWGG